MKSEAFKASIAAKKRDRFEVRHGDNLAILKTLNPNQFDSLVTDPPAGIAFMGKDWDSDKGGRDAWITWLSEVLKECYRVMKPGAYGLVWALPRTSHWTAMACEDAGFDVRDCVMHMFGSGFPKSQDISKRIDIEAGAERKVIGVSKTKSGISSSHGNAENGSTWDRVAAHFDITTPATATAAAWDGWGTALKPAYEPWWLIQKPIGEDTIAKNVLKHGTGGLNVDASRIATEDKFGGGAKMSSSGNTLGKHGEYEADGFKDGSPLGRFPANIIFDEDAAAVLDEQSGISKSQPMNKRSAKRSGDKELYRMNDQEGNFGFSDTGGASRFFYVAKPSKSDKGDENGHPTVKSTTLMHYLIRLITRPGGTVLDPFMGSGTTGVAAIRNDFKFFGIDQSEQYTRLSIDRMMGEYRVTDKKLKQQAKEAIQ